MLISFSRAGIFYLLKVLSTVRAFSPSGYFQHDGFTRLLGSSFGILGINATFDYVIIGGGTSGLTVANRLSENPHVSVAVIEGGSFYEIDNGNVSQVPAFVTEYSTPDPSSIQPLVDWGIVTVPQQQLFGRQIHYTQGKCLGGSSARNYLAYQRGTKGSYQEWANNVGDQSYTFDNLLHYFRKSPHFTPPNYAKRGKGSKVAYDLTAFSPAGGPLQVSYTNYFAPAATYFRSALVKLGVTEISGLNSGKLLGFSEFSVTIDPRAETRSSSQTSFLQESITTSTLQVYQKTLANKILFDAGKRVIGVSVVTAGRSYILSARKEIILAAGVFRSPQLLIVSGIGPGTTLQQHKIKVISDLQGVGQNMWDQPYLATSYEVNVTTQSQLTTNISFAVQATKDYLHHQTGPLTSIGGNFVGWEKLPKPYRSQLSNSTISALSTFPADWPELEILPIGATLVPTANTGNQAIFSVAVVAPTSRGNVTINSTDTNDNPLVSPNWLLTQADQELAIQGLKRMRQVASASGITVGPELLPGPAVQTEAELLAFARGSVSAIHHACASCAMGKAGDPKAVVDSHGKVFGVKGLRIVDASAFNLLPPGHTQATVYMLAEKLADDIKSGK